MYALAEKTNFVIVGNYKTEGSFWQIRRVLYWFSIQEEQLA